MELIYTCSQLFCLNHQVNQDNNNEKVLNVSLLDVQFHKCPAGVSVQQRKWDKDPVLMRLFCNRIQFFKCLLSAQKYNNTISS